MQSPGKMPLEFGFSSMHFPIIAFWGPLFLASPIAHFAAHHAYHLILACHEVPFGVVEGEDRGDNAAGFCKLLCSPKRKFPTEGGLL